MSSSTTALTTASTVPFGTGPETGTTTAASAGASTGSGAGRTGRRVGWDVVRVLAIFSVVLEHATTAAPRGFPQLGPMPVVWDPLIGANTMLLISAFFVCVTVRRGRPRAWWWNRVARLLPTYLVAVLVTYGITWLGTLLGSPITLPSGKDLLANLFLLQGWVDGVRYVDNSYWTLPIQLFSFTVAALLVRWSGMHRRWSGPVLAWGLIVGPLVVRAWVDHPGWLSHVYLGLGLYRWQLFGMGVALWLWTRGRISFGHLALVFSCGLLAEYIQDGDLHSTKALGVMLVLVLLAAGPEWRGPARHLARPMSWLASISFGMYLANQQLGYELALGMHAIGLGPWWRLAAIIGMTVGAGWLLTRFVERPTHRWLVREFPRHARTARGWLSTRWLLFTGPPAVPEVAPLDDLIGLVDEHGRPVEAIGATDAIGTVGHDWVLAPRS
ncbi:acyltransferase family protein [Gandjariella thermophila]|uniref:acyltransferase family protein n=1 Tax=Gandjariella thermophila TaxID=1931992 RepID=UPI0010F8D60C|nr:acyltransferase [Gandjariella thermophila]